MWKKLTLTSTILAQFYANLHYLLQNLFFTQRDPRDCLFVRGIAHCPRFGKSAANQAQYDTSGNPLMFL